MATQSAPHTTMAGWLHNDHHEAKIINNIREFAETLSPFVVPFDSFGQFGSKAIFINVPNQAPFSKISKGLKGSIRGLLGEKIKFPTPAHLTIARNMESIQFENAWGEWKEKEFQSFLSRNRR